MQSPLIRTALPPTVSLDSGEGQLPRLTVNNAQARAQIYLHGAHVTAWQPAGHEPVLWMSQASMWDAAKPIRGGVPICFPWFGPHATDTSAPGHGFARLRDWTLTEARDDGHGATELAFQLTTPAAPPAAWPHAFDATYRVSVGASLGLALEIRNTGADAFTFEEALHTYFAVRDVRGIDIRGLEGVDYLDKVGAATRRTQGREPIRITGETDRIYLDTRGACAIHDPAAGRRIVVGKSGSDATVVWNPWVAKAKAMPDFGDDEWPGMVCVETCNVNVHRVTLAAGARHTLTATIDAAAA
ncbi:MAG: D-hexose-6-phosphate mutarotase [Vicinamibacteraceae bacterium]